VITSADGPAVAAVYLVLLGGFGLIVGSFLNVVIYRVPEGLSVVRPGSACPQCHEPITPRDNIPVLSWLVLRGRCRHCQAPIPARYPLVEALSAVVWIALGWWALGPDGIDPLLPLLLILGSAGVALSFIDLDHHRLPNVIVLPLYPVTAAGLVLAGALSGEWPVGPALAGAAAWLAVIGGIWLVTRGRGMGLGDVKLAPVLGATLGWVSVGSAAVGLFAGFVLGAVVGVVLIARGRAGRRSHLPFGPFLLVGAAVGLFAGSAIATAYADWILG
jgi:leader peptidase (prepilin peptidase) / N-methyltransferase